MFGYNLITWLSKWKEHFYKGRAEECKRALIAKSITCVPFIRGFCVQVINNICLSLFIYPWRSFHVVFCVSYDTRITIIIIVDVVSIMKSIVRRRFRVSTDIYISVHHKCTTWVLIFLSTLKYFAQITITSSPMVEVQFKLALLVATNNVRKIKLLKCESVREVMWCSACTLFSMSKKATHNEVNLFFRFTYSFIRMREYLIRRIKVDFCVTSLHLVSYFI
jgi:hypothetical protein